MKRFAAITMTFGLCLSGSVFASEAETSAQANNSIYGNSGASATARYEGDVGFANTRTRSGEVSIARGVAVGVDEDGISLSASHAVSNRSGVGLAGNFNMTIGRDGQVAVSGGNTLSLGRRGQSADAGGATGTSRRGPTAVSSAGGSTDDRGTVSTNTFARTSDPRERRVHLACPGDDGRRAPSRSIRATPTRRHAPEPTRFSRPPLRRVGR